MNFRKGMLSCDSEEELKEYVSKNFTKNIKNFNRSIKSLTEEFNTEYYIEVYKKVLSDINEDLKNESIILDKLGYVVITEEESKYYKEMIESSYMSEQREYVIELMKEKGFVPNKTIKNILGESLFKDYLKILRK